MNEFKKLNIICPNCGSPNYMMDISSVSKEYKIKCTNCNKYFKDYDEVIKLHKEKLDETPDSQKAKADSGKPQLSLVPRRIIFDIARVREYGNNKYPEGGKDNWKNVEPERYRDAAFRHFLAYLDDPYGVDSESGLPHLHHLATNIAFLCELEDPKMDYISEISRKVKENDDWSVTFNEFNNDVVEEEPSKTIPGATIQKLSNGKLNMQLSDEHVDTEPNWTPWIETLRESDGEVEYYRIEIFTDKIQFGDFFCNLPFCESIYFSTFRQITVNVRIVNFVNSFTDFSYIGTANICVCN